MDEQIVTPEWLINNGFEEFSVNDGEFLYDGLPPQQQGDRFFREKNFHRNLFVIQLFPNELLDYAVFVQDDVGCGFTRMPLRWSELSVDRLNDLYSAFMDKKITD